MLFPEPIRSSLICSLVPLMVDTIAIMDAIKAVMIPTVEVHLSDISQREDFRKLSYLSMVCEKTICGKGFAGYSEGISYLIEKYGK